MHETKTAEALMPIGDAVRLFPHGAEPTREKMWRWIVQGVGGKKLQGRRVGGKFYTTRRAVEQFIDNGGDDA